LVPSAAAYGFIAAASSAGNIAQRPGGAAISVAAGRHKCLETGIKKPQVGHDMLVTNSAGLKYRVPEFVDANKHAKLR